MKKKKTTPAPATTAPKHPRLAWTLENIVAPLGLLMILCATCVPFALMHNPSAQSAYPFVYGAGAVILLAARMFTPHPTTDLRLRRLYRLETWTGAVFLAGIAVLFYNPVTLRDWLAFTLAGGVLQIYTCFAIPARRRTLEKEKIND